MPGRDVRPGTGPCADTGLPAAGNAAPLAARSQHRHFKLPDLIIAATAEEHGATVLHYDAGYDRIAEVTGQPAEWVTGKGSL